jgi:ssDNA-binding Zn-finger/Zn-ribbon topoisomerase 1
MNLAKVISSDSLKEFAEKIILHHKPFTIDYIAKFELKEDQKEELVEEVATGYQSSPVCPVCGKGMVQREATKGKNAGNKFWGCSQFPKCRGVITIAEEISEVEATAQEKPACPKCNGVMVKRISKKGDNASREFWGCQSFPKCRGVVAIDNQ